MSNEKKTHPVLLAAVIAFVLGMALGAWGLIREECIGPNCWVGSGFLKWAGGIMIVGGLLGMSLIGGKGRRK